MTSLHDIMSEQLAESLARPPTSVERDERVSQADVDLSRMSEAEQLAYVLSLSAAEAEADNNNAASASSASATTTTSGDADADYALALALADELAAEESQLSKEAVCFVLALFDVCSSLPLVDKQANVREACARAYSATNSTNAPSRRHTQVFVCELGRRRSSTRCVPQSLTHRRSLLPAILSTTPTTSTRSIRLLVSTWKDTNEPAKRIGMAPISHKHRTIIGVSFNSARASGAASAHNKHDARVASARNRRNIERRVAGSGDMSRVRDAQMTNRLESFFYRLL